MPFATAAAACIVQCPTGTTSTVQSAVPVCVTSDFLRSYLWFVHIIMAPVTCEFLVRDLRAQYQFSCHVIFNRCFCVHHYFFYKVLLSRLQRWPTSCFAPFTSSFWVGAFTGFDGIGSSLGLEMLDARHREKRYLYVIYNGLTKIDCSLYVTPESLVNARFNDWKIIGEDLCM